MAEKNRELATNRLLEIIRRGGTASPEPPGPEQPVPETEETTKPQPTEGEVSAEPQPPKEKAEAESDAEVSVREKPKAGLSGEPPPEPDEDVAEKVEAPEEEPGEELDFDIQIPDSFQPITRRIANRLKLKRATDKPSTKVEPEEENGNGKKELRIPSLLYAGGRSKVKGKRVFAVDIGNSFVKSVELAKSGLECRIISVKVRRIPPALRDGKTGLDAYLIKILREMLPSQRMKNVPLHLLLSDRAMQVRRLDLPAIAPKERLNAIKFQINKDLPFPAETCEIAYAGWDNRIKGRQDIEVLAVDRRDLDRRIGLLDDLGLSPTHITASPATFRYLLDGYEGIDIAKGAVAIANIGGSKTTISIVENGKVILCRTVSAGGDDFTEVLHGVPLSPSGDELNEDDAEQYKIEHGFPIEGEPQTMRIAILMRPVAERISAEISRSLEFYSRERETGALQKLILIGGGAQMKKLPEFLSENLGIGVELGNPLARIEIDPAITDEDRNTLAQFGPALLPAISLAIDDGKNLNVLPVELKTAEKLKGAKRVIPPVALGMMVCMLGLYGLAIQDLNAVEREYNSLKGKLKGLVKHRADYLIAFAEVGKLNNELSQREEDFSVIAEKAMEIPKYLKLISNLVPNYIYLDKLQTRYIVNPNFMEEEPPDPSKKGKKDETEMPEELKPTYDKVLADLLGKKEEEQRELKRRSIFGKVIELDGVISSRVR